MNELGLMIVSSLPFVGNVVNVDVRVTDEFNAPITNALVQVYTYKSNVDRFARSPRYRILEEHTDALGCARFRYTSVSDYIKCVASADGYYAEKDDKPCFASSYSDYAKVVLSEHGKSYVFKLRRKKNPASLCYVLPSSSIKLPKASGEFGFDLLMNDWIVPYGDGKVADFYVQREVSPTNNQIMVNSSIVFTGDGNGAYMRKKVKTTSDFKTGYEADTNEIYQTCLPSRRYPAPENPAYTFSSIVKEDEYIVLRTRVEKDADGNIVKANYSAMRGVVHIHDFFECLGYVFNPIPNDTNLEMNRRQSTDLERAKKKRQRRPYRRDWKRHPKDASVKSLP